MANSLCVVDVTSFFSSSCGGIRRYYEEKAKALPRAGVTCHFVVPGARDGEQPLGAATLHTLHGPPVWGNALYRRFSGHAALERLLARLAPDVIELGSHYLLPSLIERAIAKLPRRPRVVGFFHSHPEQVVQNLTTWLPGNPARPAAVPLWRFFARQHRAYDATLVASRHIEGHLTRRGVPDVVRVGLGVDVHSFVPMSDHGRKQPWVTYAGRFTSDKELPVLLEAFDRVHAQTHVGLRMVGAGPFEARLKAHARNRSWLTVQPALNSKHDVAKLLSESLVVVVPSQTETFSLTTAEAMACGTPVVGPDAGAVAELIQHSGGGATFSAGNPSSLAKVLMEMLEITPDARACFGEAGRRHVLAEFTWAAVSDRILRVYESVLARTRMLPGGPAVKTA